MQANEFEKELKNKMEGFQLVPNVEVWKQVAAAIDTDKKRKRILFFWFFTGFLFAGGATGWWFTNGDNQNANHENFTSASSNLSPEEKSPVDQPVVLKRKEGAAEPVKNVQSNNTTVISLNAAGKELKVTKGEAKTRQTRNGKIISVSPVEAAKIDKEKTKSSTLENIAELQSAGSNSTQQKPSEALAEAGVRNENNNTKTGDTLAVIASNGPEAKRVKDSNETSKESANASLANIKVTKRKKWSYSLTAYAGLSDNVAGFPVISQDKSMNYDASPINNSTGGQTAPIAPLRYSAGFSFGLGVYTTFQLSKRTGLSAGIDYHRYTAKSSVGNQVSLQNRVYDSVQQQYIASSYIYNDGSTTTYSNSYQVIELPVNLSWQINKNQKKPIRLLAGISPGYVSGSNALYANNNVRIYYVNKDQFRRYQLSGQAGLMFPVLSAKKTSFSLGPVFQYGFTNLSGKTTGSSQHLFFLGVKTNISLK